MSDSLMMMCKPLNMLECYKKHIFLTYTRIMHLLDQYSGNGLVAFV